MGMEQGEFRDRIGTIFRISFPVLCCSSLPILFYCLYSREEIEHVLNFFCLMRIEICVKSNSSMSGFIRFCVFK